MRTFVVGFVLVLSAAPAFAQSSSDQRWTPWLGCWDLVLENAREGAPSIDNSRELPRAKSNDTVRPRVCVERAPTGGARSRDATARSCRELRSAASPRGSRPAASRQAAPATPGPATSDANEHEADHAGRQRADGGA